MPQHWIQLTDQEWMDWNAVISIAHLITSKSKAKPSAYKGAISDTDAGKELRADLNALVEVSGKVVQVDDA